MAFKHSDTAVSVVHMAPQHLITAAVAMHGTVMFWCRCCQTADAVHCYSTAATALYTTLRLSTAAAVALHFALMLLPMVLHHHGTAAMLLRYSS